MNIFLGAEDSGHGSHFLFHRDLSRFYELEEQYMKALTAYTKTQFFDVGKLLLM